MGGGEERGGARRTGERGCGETSRRADALRAHVGHLREELRAHQLALAEQAKTQARYAEERESLLRQAMVGAAQRLVEYVEAAAHGGGADADAARRIGLRRRRPRARDRGGRGGRRRSSFSRDLRHGGHREHGARRARWGAFSTPPPPARRSGRERGVGADEAGGDGVSAAPAAAEARGGLPPALSRVVGLLRRLRVDPSAAAPEEESVPGLLHPLERPFALPFYL